MLTDRYCGKSCSERESPLRCSVSQCVSACLVVTADDEQKRLHSCLSFSIHRSPDARRARARARACQLAYKVPIASSASSSNTSYTVSESEMPVSSIICSIDPKVRQAIRLLLIRRLPEAPRNHG